jgi:hypothetical protein
MVSSRRYWTIEDWIRYPAPYVQLGPVAQLGLERFSVTEEVAGSNPVWIANTPTTVGVENGGTTRGPRLCRVTHARGDSLVCDRTRGPVGYFRSTLGAGGGKIQSTFSHLVPWCTGLCIPACRAVGASSILVGVAESLPVELSNRMGFQEPLIEQLKRGLRKTVGLAVL